MNQHVRFRLLGGFGVTNDSPTPRPILVSSPRQRALLAYLALRPDYAETRERLAALLWGDCTDGQARKRFRQSLLRLRREFADAGADPFRGDRDTLALDPAIVNVDAREFVARAQTGAEADLDRAADLYGGDLLDGVTLDIAPFDDWLSQERSRLRTVAAQVFERSVRIRDTRGDADGAVAAAERLVGLDASNEAAQRELIDLLARHRGRSAALAHADATAKFVKDEFACELEPETQQLIAKIRATPSALSASRARPADAQPANTGLSQLSSDATAPPSEHVPLAQPTPPATSEAAPHASRLRWRSPAALVSAASVVALASVVVVALLFAPGLGGPQSPGEAGQHAPKVADSHAAAVSRSLEGQSKSAIIVLPFSPTPPDSAPVARLADIISNDLINNLSRVPGFRVIARSTSVQYAKRPVDVGTLDTELGVDYAVEGDVRLDDGKVRINVAMIDVKTRLQVWAERYERDEADRLAAQDEIVRALARQLHVTLMAEWGRDTGSGGNPSANETLGKAWAALNLFAFFRGGQEGGQLFEDVLHADPDNVSALMGLGAFKYAASNRAQTPAATSNLLDQAEQLLRHANALNPKASLSYYFLGLVVAKRGLPDEALPLYQKTLELNPSYAPAYAAIGYVQMHTGKLAEAVENIKYAVRLSPKDNYLGVWSQYLGRAYVELGDDAEAERWLTQSITVMPNSPLSRLSLAAFLATRGDAAGAHQQAILLTKLAPRVTLNEWIETLTVLCKQDEHRPARLIAGLRQAMASVHPTE